MGLINLYNTIDNEHSVINGNGVIKDILKVNGYNLENCQIIKEGNILPLDYIVKDNDVLLIRIIPKGATGVAIAAVSGVVALVGYHAISSSIKGAKAEAQRQLQEQMEKAQRDADNLAQQINTLPFIKGAKNQSALGNYIPYQFGTMFNTPMTLTDGRTYLEGDYGKNQYFNYIFNLGYGVFKVTKVLLGDEVLLENSNGIEQGRALDFSQSSPYYDAGNMLEIAAPGADFTDDILKEKCKLIIDGAELKHDYGQEAEEVIRQIPNYTKKLEVCIQFNGLRQYSTSESTWVNRNATVNAYWSNDGGTTWNRMFFSEMYNNQVIVNSNQTLRFKASKTFNASDVMSVNAAGEIEHKEILLKVRKDTAKLESNSNEDCYLLYYQSLCYDPKKSNLTSGLIDCEVVEDNLKNKITRLGLKIKATESTKDILNDIHVEATAVAPIWNGTTWSTTKSATNNPAAVIYELLTSNIHIHSKYNSNEFDADELGALYEYCNENELTVNGYLTAPTKKSDIIDDILNACNAVMYKQDGILHFAIDKAEPLPVALINAENIKNISYTKDLARKPDGVKITYTNSKTWQIDTFYIMRDGRTYKTDEDIVVELALNYITEYKQAYKIGLRYLKKLILQPRTITAGVGFYGDRYPLLSTVLLQFKEFRQGLKSSYINKLIYNTENQIIGIYVSDLLRLNSRQGNNYGVIIQAVTESGSQLIYKKVLFDKELVGLGTTKGKITTTKGLLGVKNPGIIKTRKLYFNEPISSESIQPVPFNIVSIGSLDENGEFTKVTNKMKITGIEPDNSNGYNLTLLDYNEDIYNTGTIPAYSSNLTSPVKYGAAVPINPNSNNETAVNDAKSAIYNETGLANFQEIDITETDAATGVSYLKADLINVNKIFSNEVIINNDGVLKSENYIEDESGFKINSEGDAEFNKGYFRGGLGKTIPIDKTNFYCEFTKNSFNILFHKSTATSTSPLIRIAAVFVGMTSYSLSLSYTYTKDIAVLYGSSSSFTKETTQLESGKYQQHIKYAGDDRATETYWLQSLEF